MDKWYLLGKLPFTGTVQGRLFFSYSLYIDAVFLYIMIPPKILHISLQKCYPNPSLTWTNFHHLPQIQSVISSHVRINILRCCKFFKSIDAKLALDIIVSFFRASSNWKAISFSLFDYMIRLFLIYGWSFMSWLLIQVIEKMKEIPNMIS